MFTQALKMKNCEKPEIIKNELVFSYCIQYLFEHVSIQKVVLPDGTVYTDASAVDGGGHSGDMRQRIGKELISIGINHANYGIHSTTGPSERSP